MRDIVADQNNFIRDELIDRTIEVIHTADERFLREVLDYYADNFTSEELLQKLLEETVVYISEQAKLSKISLSNVPELIHKLRNLFRSSRTTSRDVLSIKGHLREVILESIPRARHEVQVSTQIALFIYLALRMIVAMNE